MGGSLLSGAFEHHRWATLRVIEACLDLGPDELQTDVPGTRGPIEQTLRHIVDSDAFDLFIVTGDPAFEIDAERLPLGELGVTADRVGAGWAAFIAGPLDPDEMVHEVDPSDGYERTAPLGLRIAGALEHGADHRSQICTALTTLGVTPPNIDAMSYGLAMHLVTERLPDA